MYDSILDALRRGAPAEALAAARALATERPDDARARELMAQAQRMAGDTDGALSSLDGAIALQPDEDISLLIMNKAPGLDAHIRLQQIPLSLSWGMDEQGRPPRRRIAYERLLLDALAGDSTLFVRRDEAEKAWEWVDGVSRAWAEIDSKPRPYAAGTLGPSAADGLIERTGRTWHE